MTKKIAIFFIILLSSFSLLSSGYGKKRQVIVYSAPLYIRPGRLVSPKRYINGGTAILPLMQQKAFDGRIYLRIKAGRNYYFILKSHTGKINASYPPHFAFEIGKEKVNPPLPFNYEPVDLKKLGMYVKEGSSVFLRREAAIAFTTMANEAGREGININAAYGYVSVGSYSKDYLAQEKVWENYLPKAMPKPASSLLHTGVEVYVTTNEINNDVCDHFYFTKAYTWLLENSRHYGFEFLPFSNPVDFRPYALRYNSRPSAFFKINNKACYTFYYKCPVVAFKEFRNGSFDINYLVIHDNENTATKGMFYALKKYGGYGIELVNLNNYNKRNLKISVHGSNIFVDPNRIFTKDNTVENIKRWSVNYSPEAFNAAVEKLSVIKDVILDAVSLSPKRYLLAIHTNNPYGKLSVHTFVNAKIRRNYYIYINRRMHKKSFYYVVDKRDYDYFKSRNLNVICLKKWNSKDGSLAFQAFKNRARYITIECADGNEKSMKILIDEAVGLAKLRAGRR